MQLERCQCQQSPVSWLHQFKVTGGYTTRYEIRIMVMLEKSCWRIRLESRTAKLHLELFMFCFRRNPCIASTWAARRMRGFSGKPGGNLLAMTRRFPAARWIPGMGAALTHQWCCEAPTAGSCFLLGLGFDSVSSLNWLAPVRKKQRLPISTHFIYLQVADQKNRKGRVYWLWTYKPNNLDRSKHWKMCINWCKTPRNPRTFKNSHHHHHPSYGSLLSN